MFNKTEWVAVVRERDWLLAKVSHSKLKLNIARLAAFQGEEVVPGAESTVAAEEPTLQAENGEMAQTRPDDYSESLKKWLREQKVPSHKLKLAFSCPGVITRMITLPILKPKELDKLLRDQVDQYFTLNIADYVIDYRVVDRFEEDGQLRERVLLAALPRYQWESLWSALDKVGLKPGVVDLAADAITRLYSRLEKESDMAIVDLNSSRTEFVLLEHGVFFLYSDLELNLDELKDLMLPSASPEADNVDAPANQNESGEAGAGMALPEHERSLEAVRTEVETGIAPVLKALADFINFFAARHYGKSVDCIYLTGEYANLPFLRDIFESNLEIQTIVGFPHSWRPRFKRRLRAAHKDWMKYGSLYGLALRED